MDKREEVIRKMDTEARASGFDRLPLRQWEAIYEKVTGNTVNHETTRKRRIISGLGELVPPTVYILTASEFITVLETPLPMCSRARPAV